MLAGDAIHENTGVLSVIALQVDGPSYQLDCPTCPPRTGGVAMKRQSDSWSGALPKSGLSGGVDSWAG